MPGITWKATVSRLLSLPVFSIIMVAPMVLSVSETAAFSRYNDGCQYCHGDFSDGTSPKGTSFAYYGNSKLTMHRNLSEAGTDCALCHLDVNTNLENPFIGISDGTTANTGRGCVGCHGRDQDAGHDTISAGLGAGLRQHHFNANRLIDTIFGTVSSKTCVNCHADADPANYTPVGEHVKPAYYGTADTDVDNSCNPISQHALNENWDFFNFQGLDNDGDGLYDINDPDCGGPYVPPPVRQAIGIQDGVFNNLTEADCRLCHENPAQFPVLDVSIPDRHHLLVGTIIGEPTDAPFGIAGNPFECLSCHAVDCSSGDCSIIVARDCTDCHVQGPYNLTVHHRTNLAQGNLPQGPDCQACHGSLVDNMNDGHFIATSPPSSATPKRSSGTGLPLNSRGNGAGACNYCHDDGISVEGIVVVTNRLSHHSTGLASDTAKCSWCHDFSRPFEEQIRVCENCHARDSVHNIQADSDGDSIINPGIELPGYGHIGNPDDCWGCHGFSLTGATAAPETGSIIPYISGISPSVLTAGSDTMVTISGSAFKNMAQGSELTCNVTLTALDGSAIELIPDTVNENVMTVTIPGNLATGNYALKAVKLAKFSNPVYISIKPVIMINAVTCKKCLGVITISGTGFGDAPPEGAQDFLNVTENGVPLNIISWTDTEIKATGTGCSGTIAVNALFGSAIWP